MDVLWISVLIITFGRLCLMQVTDSSTTESKESKITDIKITHEQNDTNIKFDLEWKYNYDDIYSYFVETRIIYNLNINNTNANKCYNKVAFRHDPFKRKSSASISSTYLPSATYLISITPCYNKRVVCTGVINCSDQCRLLKHIYHHTPPIQPIINLKNITCEDYKCEININVTNIQPSNSYLYSYQLEKEKNISMDFVKKIIEMDTYYNYNIAWSDRENIITTFDKSDICNKRIILLLVNDYMGLLNYTAKDLTNFTKKSVCESTLIIDILWLTAEANYYYLIFIIPIVILIIGVIACIKRKLIFGCCQSSRSGTDPSSQSLVGNDGTAQHTKIYIPTPEILKQLLQCDSNYIKNSLHTELQNILDGDSRQLYGELFESKNRYRHILPFEQTRVTLDLLRNKPDSHYINASYIKGYKQDKKYIAAQGPLEETLSDFWRMIWQEEISLIVMLTNLKENFTEHCEQYWPDKDFTFYRNYNVTVENIEKFVEYTRREFVVTHLKISRKLTQMQFTIWKEKGIPQTPYSLVTFLKETRKHTNGPILVHCNDGINRTGTFILCDYIIDMAESGTINFPQALYALRKCRKSMIQNNVQYLYAYCVINEFLNGNFNAISVDEFKKNNVSEENVIETLKKIQNNDYWLNILHPSIACEGYNENRTAIGEYANSKPCNIDTVEILKKPKNLIINTLQPSPNTLTAFWMMVLEKKLSLILSLQELDVNDKASIQFWPTANETLNPVDYINITQIQDTTFDTYNKIHIKLDDTRNNDINYVHILHFKMWKRNSLPKIDEFLFYHKMYSQHKYKEGTIVACSNAVDASSVFLTFLFVVDALNQNSTIDVNAAISILKIYRRNFDFNKEKLEFIYDALKIYLQDINKKCSKDFVDYQNLL